MIYEWDGRKAARNLTKHGISFEEAATVFHDPLAMTFPDPDHSPDEGREITIGHTMKQRLAFVAHCQRGIRIRLISARLATNAERSSMKKESSKTTVDELRKEYDLSSLQRGVRGKYYCRATAGTNLVLIDADLAHVFPDSDSVNRALRLLVETARAADSARRRKS